MPESKKRKSARPSGPTPPSSKVDRKGPPSPTWYVATMAGLMALGTLLVIVRFVFNLDQLWLVGGLALIGAGFMMSTNYR